MGDGLRCARPRSMLGGAQLINDIQARMMTRIANWATDYENDRRASDRKREGGNTKT